MEQPQGLDFCEESHIQYEGDSTQKRAYTT